MKKLLTFLTLLTLSIGVSWAETATWPGTTALPGTATSIGESPIKIKVSSTNTYSNPIRVYAGTTITITADAGYVINSVTYEASSTGNYVTNAEEAAVTPQVTPTVSGKNVTWSYGNNSEVTEFTFKPSNQTRANSITINYSASGSTTQTVSTPSFSLATGTYSGTQKVSINCLTEGATIYYTTDGTNPTTSSNVYSTPISVSSSQTIKAFAVANGYEDSEVASATYTIVPTLYLISNSLNGASDWDVSTGALMSYDSSTGRYSTTIFMDQANNYFQFAQGLSDGATNWSGLSGRIFPSTSSGINVDVNNYDMDGTVPLALTNSDTNASFWAPAGVYTISVDLDDLKCYVEQKIINVTFTPDGGDVDLNSNATISSNLYSLLHGINSSIKQSDITYATSTDNSNYTDGASYQFTTPGNVTLYGKSYYNNISGVASKQFTVSSTAADEYVLVTSDADLNENDEYILFSKGDNNQTGYAMAAYTSGNNYPQTATSAMVSDGKINAPEGSQVITLEKTTVAVGDETVDAWYIKTGEGYAYAASSGSNYMKQSATANDNCKATITFNQNAAIITFRGEYSRNIVRHNTGSKIFSCYASGQNPVFLYKKSASSATSAKPTISPASGNIKGGKVSVTITAAEGATIYYTKDGTDPDTESDVYTEGFDLTGAAGSSKTVKAIAVETGKEASAIVTATYTFIAPSKPTFSPESGTSQESSISVTISSSDEGTIYYMVDPETAPTAGGTIVDNGTEYNGAITLSEVGDHTIYATVLLNDITSSVASATYTITSSGTQVEEKTLAQIETLGTAAVGNTYTITDALVAVYANEDILWCKDQATSIAAYNNPDPETYIDYMQVYGDAAEAQQNNWVALKFTGATQAQLDAVYRAVGSTIDAKTVTGKVIDGVNYTIEVSNMELTTTDGGNDAKNTYCPANFLQENLFGQATGHTETTSDKKYFFVNPKIQEVCEVTFAMWNGNYFVVPAANGISNDSEIPGAFNVDWKYNDKNDVSSSIDQNTVYRFNAVVQKPESSPAVEGDYVKVTSNTDLTNGDYLIVVETEGESRKYAFVFDGSLNTLDAAHNNLSDDGTGYVIVNNTIASTKDIDNAVFTIDVDAGTIKSSSGYYIYMNKDDNGLKQLATVPDSEYANAISISDGNAEIVCKSAHLRYNPNTDQDRFRYYKSSSYANQSAIALYKKNVKATAPRLKANNSDSPMTDVEPDGSYMVYPLNFDPNDAENNIVTAINTVDVAGNGVVKSVKYVNVAGMVSDKPFSGVNIVVTEYTDGSRTTSKMLRK